MASDDGRWHSLHRSFTSLPERLDCRRAQHAGNFDGHGDRQARGRTDHQQETPPRSHSVSAQSLNHRPPRKITGNDHFFARKVGRGAVRTYAPAAGLPSVCSTPAAPIKLGRVLPFPASRGNSSHFGGDLIVGGYHAKARQTGVCMIFSVQYGRKDSWDHRLSLHTAAGWIHRYW